MLANAYEGLGEGKTQFSIPTSLLAEWSGFESNDYQLIYDHCRELMSTQVLTMNFDNRPKGRSRRRRGGTTLVADFDVGEGGTVTYNFSPKMAKLLHEPDQYIWMALSTQNKFSSKYELNLFENCIRYIGVNTTGFKDVEDWRAVLGAEEATYNQFKDFNKKVLKPAIKGVNSKSGIIVDPEFEREKRRIARIKFNVRENPQLSLLDHHTHSKLRESDGYKALREHGIEDVLALHFVEQKGETAVLEAVAYVADKTPKNPTGYLVHTLKQGYGEKTSAEREQAAQAEERAAAAKAAREAEAERERAEHVLKERFRAHQVARTAAILADLSVDDYAWVQTTISDDIAIPAVAQKWAEVDRDIGRLNEMPKMARGIMQSRLHKVVLGKWGRQEDQDIEAFGLSAASGSGC